MLSFLKNKPVILIVDDSSTIRMIFQTALIKRGYEVLEAQDGNEGVKMAMDNKPDAIIMDCVMPVVDGWQACRTLRCTPRTKKIPVIMCTAENSIEEVERSLDMGATDYIPKSSGTSLNLDRLLKAVERVLQGFRLEPVA